MVVGEAVVIANLQCLYLSFRSSMKLPSLHVTSRLAPSNPLDLITQLLFQLLQISLDFCPVRGGAAGSPLGLLLSPSIIGQTRKWELNLPPNLRTKDVR